MGVERGWIEDEKGKTNREMSSAGWLLINKLKGEKEERSFNVDLGGDKEKLRVHLQGNCWESVQALCSPCEDSILR